MAIITNEGLVAEPLEVHIEAYRDIMRAVFGQDLAFAIESPQEQWASLNGFKSVVDDHVAVYLANTTNRQRAIRPQLISMASLHATFPRIATKSAITAILYGQPGTLVPTGSRAATTAGDIYVLEADVPITLQQGVGAGQGFFLSAESGPIEGQANDLAQIITPVLGWTRVNNPLAAIPGRFREQTGAFRARWGRITARNSRGSEESMESAISEVEGVDFVLVDSNETGQSQTIQGIANVPSGQIIAIVRGGEVAAVAAGIALMKPMGVPMFGPVKADDNGYHYHEVVDVPITVTLDANAVINVVDNVKDAAVEYVARLSIGEEVDFLDLGVVIKRYDSNIKIARTGFAAIRKDNSVDITAAGSVAATEKLTLVLTDVAVN